MSVDQDPWPERALRAAASLAVTVGAEGMAMVGSHARGEARADSDVDLVLLLPDPQALLASTDWFGAFGEGSELVRAEDFGGVQERRLRLPDGHVVEVCIGSVGWACVDPVDPGTAAVVRGGFQILHDPSGLMRTLREAVGE